MKPFSTNACAGYYSNWLEVPLTDKCNGRCAWCVEQGGFRPTERVSWEVLASQIIESGKKNIILLGGEPLLFENIGKLIHAVREAGCNVYVTSNGAKLTPEFAKEELSELTGINVSIHDYILSENKRIVGVELKEDVLRETIQVLHESGVKVRFNCNIIKQHIDTNVQLYSYIAWAKSLGVDELRFGELKDAEDSFISLCEIMKGDYGLNEDPYRLGCSKNAEIMGMSISFRQMCGFCTFLRPKPDTPEQVGKPVLYYNGKFYNGWQRANGGTPMHIKSVQATNEGKTDFAKQFEEFIENLSPEEARILALKLKLKGIVSTETIHTTETAGSNYCAY